VKTKIGSVFAFLVVLVACGASLCAACEAMLAAEEAACQNEMISQPSTAIYSSGSCTKVAAGEPDLEGSRMHLGGCIFVSGMCDMGNGTKKIPTPSDPGQVQMGGF